MYFGMRVFSDEVLPALNEPIHPNIYQRCISQICEKEENQIQENPLRYTEVSNGTSLEKKNELKKKTR